MDVHRRRSSEVWVGQWVGGCGEIKELMNELTYMGLVFASELAVTQN